MKTTNEFMTKKPITIASNDSMIKASTIMNEQGFRHLPVVDERKVVVGILSDRDVQRAMSVKKINKFQMKVNLDADFLVEDFMSWPVQVVSNTTPIKKVAEEMLAQKVSAFVVEDYKGHMVGIITTDDILKIFLMENTDKTFTGLKSLSHYFQESYKHI